MDAAGKVGLTFVDLTFVARQSYDSVAHTFHEFSSHDSALRPHFASYRKERRWVWATAIVMKQSDG